MSKEPVALEGLSRGAANFRFMMNAFADEYVQAVAAGRGEHLLAAVRAYINLVESSFPEYVKRKDATP